MADDDLIAVLAHGWLNTMAVVLGSAETLREHVDRLSPTTRDQLLGMVGEHAHFLAGSFVDFLSTTSPDLRAVLDALQDRSQEP